LLHGRPGAGCAGRHGDIRLESHQLGRQDRKSIILTLRPPVVEAFGQLHELGYAEGRNIVIDEMRLQGR